MLPTCCCRLPVPSTSRALPACLAGMLLEGRPAGAPFSLLASKSSLGHSEPASGSMGLHRLCKVRRGTGIGPPAGATVELRIAAAMCCAPRRCEPPTG